MIRFRFVAVAAACFFVAGCAYSPGLVDRAVAFNKAVATSTNELLLLNALRARDRLPTYYTRVASDSASTTIQPTASLAIPFGPNSVQKGFSSQFNLGMATQSQLSLQNLDDQKFMRGVLTPVPVDVLSFYLQQGWPPELVLMTTVSRITVPRSATEPLMAAFDAQCAKSATTDYCNNVLPSGFVAPVGQQYVVAQLRNCVRTLENGQSSDQASLDFENYPGSAGQASCFQWMVRLLIALDPIPRSAESYQVVARDVPSSDLKGLSAIIGMNGVGAGSGKSSFVVVENAQHKFTVCKKKEISGLALLHFKDHVTTSKHPAVLGDDSGSSASDQGDISVQIGAAPAKAPQCGATQKYGAKGDAAGAASEQAQVRLTTRSLEGMIYYLGEVLRAEGSDDGEIPQAAATSVWAWNRIQHRDMVWGLFLADRGSVPSDSAVSVDFDGHTYFVPSECSDTQACPDPRHRHRTLQVLALLNQIWGLQKETAQMPIVPTVTVVNP